MIARHTMAAVQSHPVAVLPRQAIPQHGATPLAMPSGSAPLRAATTDNVTSRVNRLTLDAFSPVNQNGSYEFDRVIKSGYVQKRTQKTRTWKSVFLVLRPNVLYIYKSDKEDKLRYKMYLSDLTAITVPKDPKQKRQNVFGLFSPSKNFHFQAPTALDTQQWVDLIRQDSRIDEEEEDMSLASPGARRQSYAGAGPLPRPMGGMDRIASSSPEPFPNIPPRRPTMIAEYSGLSGNEIASHSDFSDGEGQQRIPGASIESLALQNQQHQNQQQNQHNQHQSSNSNSSQRPGLGFRNPSQTSMGGLNMERDHHPDRIIWQGWLWFLRSRRGVKQWKNMWAVLRARNLILYKDESEYTAQFIVPLSAVLNVVDIDPVSKSKTHCLQIITDEKSYRFCAHDEEPLVQCLGAFKSLLARRREMETRAVAMEKGKGKQVNPAVPA